MIDIIISRCKYLIKELLKKEVIDHDFNADLI